MTQSGGLIVGERHTWNAVVAKQAQMRILNAAITGYVATCSKGTQCHRQSGRRNDNVPGTMGDMVEVRQSSTRIDGARSGEALDLKRRRGKRVWDYESRFRGMGAASDGTADATAVARAREGSGGRCTPRKRRKYSSESGRELCGVEICAGKEGMSERVIVDRWNPKFVAVEVCGILVLCRSKLGTLLIIAIDLALEI